MAFSTAEAGVSMQVKPLSLLFLSHSRKQLLADAECLGNVLLFPMSRRDVTGTLLAPLFLP